MASTEPNSTNTEPLKSLLAACRRRRTPLMGPTSEKKALMPSSVASKGKGAAYSDRSSTPLTAASGSRAAARLTLVPSALTSREEHSFSVSPTCTTQPMVRAVLRNTGAFACPFACALWACFWRLSLWSSLNKPLRPAGDRRGNAQTCLLA